MPPVPKLVVEDEMPSLCTWISAYPLQGAGLKAAIVAAGGMLDPLD